jgi:hypothetical protein
MLPVSKMVEKLNADVQSPPPIRRTRGYVRGNRRSSRRSSGSVVGPLRARSPARVLPRLSSRRFQFKTPERGISPEPALVAHDFVMSPESPPAALSRKRAAMLQSEPFSTEATLSSPSARHLLLPEDTKRLSDQLSVLQVAPEGPEDELNDAAACSALVAAPTAISRPRRGMSTPDYAESNDDLIGSKRASRATDTPVVESIPKHILAKLQQCNGGLGKKNAPPVNRKNGKGSNAPSSGRSSLFLQRFLVACEEVCSRDNELLPVFHQHITGLVKSQKLNDFFAVDKAMRLVFVGAYHIFACKSARLQTAANQRIVTRVSVDRLRFMRT